MFAVCGGGDVTHEASVRGKPLADLLPRLGLRHEDFVTGRNTGRNDFPSHVRTLGKFGKLGAECTGVWTVPGSRGMIGGWNQRPETTPYPGLDPSARTDPQVELEVNESGDMEPLLSRRNGESPEEPDGGKVHVRTVGGGGDRRLYSAKSNRRDRSASVLRLVGWNVLLVMAGLALIGLTGEAWFRLMMPFAVKHHLKQFVPGVGVIGKPDTEVRWSNSRDFWIVSRTNSLGFLDREPIDPERAAASCHVAVIGDSFVEALEVAIADKFHVVLEALAARELPHLDITTSAFGLSGSGQVNQLPLYDEYARHLHPRLVVLVFVENDIVNNFAILNAYYHGWGPERRPWYTAARDEDGKIGLRPPDPDYETFRLTRGTGLSESTVRTLNQWWKKARGTSFFADWLYAEARHLFSARLQKNRVDQESFQQSLPRYAWIHDGSKMTTGIWRTLARMLQDPESVTGDLRFFAQEVVDMTVFALDEFKTRADRDGAAVVILSAISDTWSEDVLNALAGARGMPVISQFDYAISQGGRIEDGRWPYNVHWSPTGHRWAAEALLEWLREHQDVCEPRAS